MYSGEAEADAMNQLSWFEEFDAQRMCRSTDCGTSRDAARGMVESGQLRGQQETVMQLVTAHPGSTSAEIGALLQMGEKGRHAAGRRLPELAKFGYVRRGDARECTVNGTKAITWWPV